MIFFYSDFQNRGITGGAGGSALILSIGDVPSGNWIGREKRICSCFVSNQGAVGLDRLQSRLPAGETRGIPEYFGRERRILAIVTKSEAEAWPSQFGDPGVRRVPLSEIKDDLSRFLREAEGEVKAASLLRRAPNRHRSAGGRVCRASRHDRRRRQGARHLRRASPTCAARRSEPPSGTATATPGRR